MHYDISIEEAFKKENVFFVDVRSPDEFAKDAIPSAVNVPILDNEQRAQVGRIYQELGPKEARFLAIKLVSPLLPEKIKTIGDLSAGKTIVVYCWRGGMRSKAMCEFLNLAGFPTLRLAGGYKSYRRYINNYFNDPPNFNFIVLYGLTGVGKTEILEQLSIKGIPALNLEALAKHRGSVFGGIGLPNQPSQKKFETELYSVLNQHQASQYIFVEGESRKIGKLFIPEKIYAAILKGKKILLLDSIHNRVNRIIKEYMVESKHSIQEFETAIVSLQKRIGNSKTQELLEFLHTENYAELVKELLISYYDKLYRHPDNPNIEYDYCINGANIEDAVLQLDRFYQSLS